MAIGDMFVLGLGAAIILGAVTPFFRKLTPTQAAAVAFGVLLIAAPMLKDYSLSLLGVSVTKDEASEVTDSLSSQIDALNTRVNELQKALPVLASPTATPDQRNLALAATAASATAYNNVAKNALVTRLRVLPSLNQNFIAAGAATAPAAAAPSGP